MYELKTDAEFDSAHFLADYGGRCENLHGHRWKIVATIAQQALKDSPDERDMVCDFKIFKQAVADIAEELDHTFLVEAGTLSDSVLSALEESGFSPTILPFRTTAENLARYVFEKLEDSGFPVCEVEVDETPSNRAIYRR